MLRVGVIERLGECGQVGPVGIVLASDVMAHSCQTGVWVLVLYASLTWVLLATRMQRHKET